MKKINNIYLALAVLALQSLFVHGAAPADQEAKESHADTPPSYEQAVRESAGSSWTSEEWDVMRYLLSRPDLSVTFTAAYANIAQNKEMMSPAATNRLRSYKVTRHDF